MEDSRLQASYMLQSSLQSNGDRRYATPPQQISAYNRKSVPRVEENLTEKFLKPKVNVVFGEDVCCISY